MAKIAFKAGEDYALKLSRLAGDSERVAKRALYEAADIVADKVRANLEANLKDQSSAGERGGTGRKNAHNQTSGDLLESFGVTPIQLSRDGWWTVKIGFDGYDRKGVANQLKARVMESGSSTIRARPFIRPAVNATKKAAVAAMGRVVDEETEKIMKG